MRSRTLIAMLSALILLATLVACNSSSPTQTTPPSGGGGTPVTAASISATPGNTFSPSEVNLAAGGTVTFSNSGGGIHNVSAAEFRCANGCDGEGGNGSPSAASWSFTRTFPDPGTVGFVCDEHSSVGMNGRIIVQ